MQASQAGFRWISARIVWVTYYDFYNSSVVKLHVDLKLIS